MKTTIMNLSEFSVVIPEDVVLHKQISDHPNFDAQPIVREVVLDDIRLSPKSGVKSLSIDYYINHYNEQKLDKSFVKQTLVWNITDFQQITHRDFSKPDLPPLANPDYDLAVAKNKLDKFIINPLYVSDEELAKFPKMIPNPAYVDEDTTPGIMTEILNPEYYDMLARNKYTKEIANPDYVSDEELAKFPKFKMSPAFSYIYPIMRNNPAMLFELLSFYIDEQDKDGFFDSYI